MFLRGCAANGLRVQHRTFRETEAAIDADGPRIVFVDRQEGAFAFKTNALDESAHDGRCKSSAFEFRKSGDCGDLAIAGDMQTQSAHRDQFVAFANPLERPDLLNTLTKRTARPI